MSATMHTEPTPLDRSRSDHPSLSPAPRPVLITAEDIAAEGGLPLAAERHLPGGAVLLERRPTPAAAELQLVGEIDSFDRGSVIDTCTAVWLEGARHLRIDASELAFVDLRVLQALAKVALHFHRFGGSCELTGLREPFAAMWAEIAPDIAPDNAVTLAVPHGRHDDGVVALHGSPSLEASQGSPPALRVVPDLDADGEPSWSRPA